MNEKKEISINLNEEYFSDFILNFLGNKENIKYSDSISFEIILNDIEQFYYLLEEKINKEQFTHINSFSLSIIYNDNTRRKINGISQLNKFNETRTVYVTSITMTWNIILKFPENKTIENQKIDISFYIEKDKDIFYKEDDNDEFYYYLTDENSGRVLMNIEHTNQAWAIEVLNLLKTQTKNLTIRKSKNERYFRKLNVFFDFEKIFGFFIILVFYFVIQVLLNPMLYNAKHSSIKYEILKTKIELEETSEKNITIFALENLAHDEINKVADENIKNKDYKKILINHNSLREKEEEKVYIEILVVFSSLIIMFISIVFYLKKGVKFFGNKSFILITKRSYKMHEEYKESKRKSEFYSIGFIVFTILTGLVINFIYQYLAS